MIIYKQLFLNMNHLHVICWTIAALVALLPLTRDSYGQDDDFNETTICWLHCKEHDCYLWTLGLYISTLIINIALMSRYLHKIHTYLKSQMEDRVGRERVLFRSLYWYPIVLVVCWTFIIVAELLIAAQFEHEKILAQIASIITSQYGTICCLIFFSNSSSVRNHWWTFLFNYNSYRQNTISQTDQSSRLSFLGDSTNIEIAAAVPPLFDITDSIDRLHHHHNSRDDVNDGNIECRTISISSSCTSMNGLSLSIEPLRDRNISMEPDVLYKMHGGTRNILLSSSSSADNKKIIDL
jgi:hypothetical protein